MAEQDLDRNLAATPYKLEKARERGQVPRSTDVVSALTLLSAMVFLASQGLGTWREQFRVDRAVLLLSTSVGGSPAALWRVTEQAFRSTVVLAAPFLATITLVAILSNLVQSGPVFSTEPLSPDWTRINPATGLKRLFSMRTLFSAGRTLLKLTLLSTVVWVALEDLLPRFMAVSALPPAAQLRTLLDDIASVGFRIAAMLVLIAIVDLLYTRREFAKQMRMSNREQRDEVKHREGDPRIRARLRELRRELLKRSLALRKARKADVMITNPTHLAVALRYQHGEMEAPVVVAKGAGQLAAVLRQIAARHQIPVVQNPVVARALYRKVPVDQGVPPELYAQVARIIAWVMAMREARPGAAARATGSL
jgi:flagellar biosynthetic protein FlhB